MTYAESFSIFVCLLLLLVGCTEEPSNPPPPPEEIPFEREGTLTFHPDPDLQPVTIDIEIADTDSARSRGLMQRESLPPQSGMLFIFEREEQQSFWMANTPLSLDIFFADSGGRIVNIAKYTRPHSSEQIRSGDPAQYVVEVQAGFADQYGIVEGDSIRWKRTADV